MNKILVCLFIAFHGFCLQASLYTYDRKNYILAPNQFEAYRIEMVRKVDLLLAQIRSEIYESETDESEIDHSASISLVGEQGNVDFEGSDIVGSYTFLVKDPRLFHVHPELVFLLLIVKDLKEDEELIIPVTMYGADGYPVQDRKVLFTQDLHGYIIGHSCSNRDDRVARFVPFKQQDINNAIKLK